MYSYSGRLRAVELYIRLGKRVKATIRQLGYPTKNALKSWYREYEQRRDLCVRYPARTPKYSDEQKQAALEYYRTHDRCISATMRALGYPGRGRWKTGRLMQHCFSTSRVMGKHRPARNLASAKSSRARNPRQTKAAARGLK